ncbi:MAG: DMT family transporter [Rhodospirillaceae bacterium]|nr:DMT family transporter [Rhodospirillaceae bacterium]
MSSIAAGAPDSAAKRRGNFLGLFAIMLWSVWAPLMVAGGAMPPFLFIATAFTSASVVMLSRRVILRRGFSDLWRIPLPTLALGFAGLWGSNVVFSVALRLGAEPVSATIVSHTWPIMMVAVILALRISRGTIWDLFALAFGFAGLVSVATSDGGFTFHIGLALALVSGFLWAFYSGARTKVPAGPPDALTAFAVTAAVASWIGHFVLGEPFAAVPHHVLIAVAVGVLPMGIANALWDISMRRGDPVTIAALSFLEPIAATAIILIMLAQWPNPGDVLGLALVLTGVALSTIGQRRRRDAAARPAVPLKPPVGPAPHMPETRPAPAVEPYREGPPGSG